MSDMQGKDWRQLSEAASQEKDPQKLLELIEQLNKVLDQRKPGWGSHPLPERTPDREACHHAAERTWLSAARL